MPKEKLQGQIGQKGSIHEKGFFDNRFLYGRYSIRNQKKTLLIKILTPKYEDIAPFMKVTPDLASALTPKIRLYKVWHNKAGDLEQQEIVFRNFEDKKRIESLATLSGEVDRGNGAGIKSF